MADWIDLDAQKPVMAHELTHALQDQHFNLQRLSKWPHGDSDAELAAHALVEGDATLAMTRIRLAHPDLMAALMASASGASDQITRAPRSLREGLTFPFDQGLMWVTQLQQRGGWAAVSAAFAKMPLSSEQILHLEKYDSYEAPIKVTIPRSKDCWAAAGRGSMRMSRVNGATTPHSMNFSRHRMCRRRPPLDGGAIVTPSTRGRRQATSAWCSSPSGTRRRTRASSPTRTPNALRCAMASSKGPPGRAPGTPTRATS